MPNVTRRVYIFCLNVSKFTTFAFWLSSMTFSILFKTMNAAFCWSQHISNRVQQCCICIHNVVILAQSATSNQIFHANMLSAFSDQNHRLHSINWQDRLKNLTAKKTDTILNHKQRENDVRTVFSQCQFNYQNQLCIINSNLVSIYGKPLMSLQSSQFKCSLFNFFNYLVPCRLKWSIVWINPYIFTYFSRVILSYDIPSLPNIKLLLCYRSDYIYIIIFSVMSHCTQLTQDGLYSKLTYSSM